MLVRKQILVPAALDKGIRRLAQKRGISQSALIVAAAEASLDASGQIDHLTPASSKADRPRFRSLSTTFTVDAGPRALGWPIRSARL
jgi:hypothetical protein